MDKLSEFQILIGWKDEMFMPSGIPLDVFHYTSSAGFESILFRNPNCVELWASRYDCLNDASEGTVAIQTYKCVCEKMKNSGEMNEQLFQMFYRIVQPHTMLMWHSEGDKDILTRPEYHRYVCSFSKNRDSLAMWNYYSKGNRYEGFNLGFYADTLKGEIEAYLRPYESMVSIYPVIYNRAEQEELIEKLIKKLIEYYSHDQETSIRYIVANQLMKWGLIFKNEFFQHEQEVRLIIDIGIHPNGNNHEIPQIDVNYRISNGYTVPYIILPFEKHCVSQVTVGPLQCDTSHKALQATVLHERLSKSGYDVIENISEIPVRY